MSRTYPALLKGSNGYTNAFLIDPDEYGRSVDLDEDRHFCDGKVFVLWKWEWQDTPDEHESAGDGASSNVYTELSDYECEPDDFSSTLAYTFCTF